MFRNIYTKDLTTLVLVKQKLLWQGLDSKVHILAALYQVAWITPMSNEACYVQYGICWTSKIVNTSESLWLTTYCCIQVTSSRPSIDKLKRLTFNNSSLSLHSSLFQ